MAYNYYRSNYPGWGSQQLQFNAPPVPGFQPQSNWTGWDYYRAHALHPDHGLFYSAMDRTRDPNAVRGVGIHEARVWHRRVYSGLVNLGQLLPTDLGAAAAYEAYRMWKHRHDILFDSLDRRREREREAIIGMALAEASHLWSYSGRAPDSRGLHNCMEWAAVTASRIARRVLDSRDSSPGSSYNNGMYNNTYQRNRRTSVAGGTAPIPIQPAGAVYTNYNNGLPRSYGPGGFIAPASGASGYGGGLAPGAYGTPGYGGEYSGMGLPRSTGSSGLAGYPGGSPNPDHYALSSPNLYGAQPSTGYSQPYAGSGSYDGASGAGSTIAYTSGSGKMTTIPAPPGSTIIIQGPRRSRRSSTSGRHHHYRSRSVEPVRYRY